MDSNSFFHIVIYILCIILLIVLIFLFVKLIFTLNKVDKLIDDISEKSKKIDGAFNLVDRVTDTVASVSDKFTGVIFNAITGLSKKVKKKRERDEEDE